jgi:hypothetical protein
MNSPRTVGQDSKLHNINSVRNYPLIVQNYPALTKSFVLMIFTKNLDKIIQNMVKTNVKYDILTSNSNKK